jgi:hypothetical protein
MSSHDFLSTGSDDAATGIQGFRTDRPANRSRRLMSFVLIRLRPCSVPRAHLVHVRVGGPTSMTPSSSNRPRRRRWIHDPEFR